VVVNPTLVWQAGSQTSPIAKAPRTVTWKRTSPQRERPLGPVTVDDGNGPCDLPQGPGQELEVDGRHAEDHSVQPHARLLRTFHDGELAAEAWLQWMGFTDARCTSGGRDGGVDVIGQNLIAQVKMEAKRSTQPQLQRLSGVAAAHPASTTAFFSLNGFTSQAVKWASQTGMALFQFDLQGEPEPKGAAARALFSSAMDADRKSADAALSDRDPKPDPETGPSDALSQRLVPGAYRRLEDLPGHYLADRVAAGEIPSPHWRALDWPQDQYGLPLSALEVAQIWPIDPQPWPWVEATDEQSLYEALDFRRRLRPRPCLQFGAGRSAHGWAWVAFEMDAKTSTSAGSGCSHRSGRTARAFRLSLRSPNLGVKPRPRTRRWCSL
jgi:hypothetical protein